MLPTGEQSQLSTELRIKVVGKIVKNRSLYDAGDFLKYGTDNFEEDILDSMRDETYSSFRHMYALANGVFSKIRSVYPESKNLFVKRNYLNIAISPRVKTGNTESILWSHTTNTDLVNDWQPNHFVLLIPERLIRVKPNKTQPVQRKRGITNIFAIIPSSKSIEKKTEVTQVPPPKKMKKKKEVKKEGEGKTAEKKNKKNNHSTRKLEGSATYRCKFDKEWSKKNPCIQPDKEDPSASFVQFAQRKLVVPIMLLGMLSETVKQLFILSFKMKCTDNTKLRNLMIF